MATLLYPRDSVSFVQNAIRRHTRLCRQTSGAEVLINAISPIGQQLDEKKKLCDLAAEARENVYDDILLADRDLDNAVRNAFDASKQYERSNPGSPVLSKLFPNGTFSDIVRMPYADEPDETEKLAVRIASLGNQHPLFVHADTLRARAEAVRKAIQSFKDALKAEKAAEAEVEIAKLAAIRQYEHNYLEARKTLGVMLAERLFPALHARSNGNNEEEKPASENAA